MTMPKTATKSACAVLLLLLLFTGFPAGTPAADGFIEGQRALVRRLCSGSDHFGCITEARRLMHYDPGGDRCEYRFLIAAAYYRGGQYRSVLAREGGICGAGPRERALLAMAHMRLGEFGPAVAALTPLPYDTVVPEHRLRLLTLRIELAVSGGPRPLRLEIATAAPFLRDDAAFVQLCRLSDEYLDDGRRSPVLAVALSALFPGAGQAYAGMPLEGLLGFIGIAAAGTGAWLLYRGGRRDISYACMFFCGLFYAGNLYGAHEAAVRWNQRRDTRFLGELHRRVAPEYDPMRDLGGPVTGR